MANLSEDIQCVGSDTRPPMLDRTDFASWKQRIRLYCRGKENGVNILKSIDEGPFQMGTIRDPIAKGIEGSQHLGLPKDIYTLINHYTDAKDIWDNVKMLMGGFELTKEDRESRLYGDFEHFCQNKGETIHDYYWGRFITAVKLNRGLRDSNYDQLYAYLKQHKAHANENKMMLDRFTQHTVDPLALMSNVSHQQYYSQSSTTPPHFADNTQLDSRISPTDNLIENLTNTLALLTQSYKTYLPQTNNQLRTSSNTRNQAIVQDGRLLFRMFRVDRIEVRGAMHGVQVQLVMREFRTELGMQIQVKQDRLSATTATDLALNVDNVFQADDFDAFDSNVDEAPTAQTMFMANLSSTDPVYDKASPSYDSDILSEVHNHDHYQDAVCEHHEVHEMHDDVQPNYIVDSHADYTSDSNMIPYDQYVKDNAVIVVQSNVSFIPNDAYMMILNDIYEPSAQCVSVPTQNNVVDNSLTAELATYKEQVELYKRRAKFELTEREQKINEQLRIVIANRNQEVASLKKDFKQKENKYLDEFLDMKALKEKNKVVIGYKNPLCLTRAKQVLPALYNGHETIKTNHVPAIVHNSEDTLEIAEITRKKINDKMKDPECVKKKVKIVPHDYSKENYLVTFTPQKQLTLEQIFWSKDLIKMKAEALKEQTTAS
ncbi:hypothetical protein Tco_0256693 [Tanacetum coccineum]